MSPTCWADIIGMLATDTNVCRLGDVADRHKSWHCQPSIQAFSNILSLGDLNEVKLQALVEEMGKFVFAADYKDIMSLHSPKNFGMNEVLSRKQSSMHAWHWFLSNLHPIGFNSEA